MAFTHQGVSEFDLGYTHVHLSTTTTQPLYAAARSTVRLTGIGPDAVDCMYSSAAVLDVGCVLGHRDELAMVASIVPGSGSTSHVRLIRGYNGTARRRHQVADWVIEVIPFPQDFGARHVSEVQCRTCGAPDQPIGRKCHYCTARVQPRP